MATVFMYSGGELVRTFGRVDDNSVTRQNDHTLTFKFFDMGLAGIPDDTTDLGANSARLPRFPTTDHFQRNPGQRRVTISADWCVIYEPEAKP
jgi:hypothetical protein